MELDGRGAPGTGGRDGGLDREALRARRGRRASALRRHRHGRRRAAVDRHRRVRSRARRRRRSRIAGAHRRRAGDRQVDAAAAGAAHFARTIGPVLYCSGEESEHQIKSRGERLGVERAPLYILAETCLERILEEIARLRPALRDRRFDSDRVLAQVPVGARQHRPGARVGDATPLCRQGPEHPDVSRRTCHQGRQPRRPEGARAHRRHRACTSRERSTTRIASSGR